MPDKRQVKMMGLKVVLEGQGTCNSADKTHQILSKSSMINKPVSFPSRPRSCPLRPRSSSISRSNTAFLDVCYLCRRQLLHHQDIYMYRDRAFCSEQCRCKLLTVEDSRRC